MEEETIRWPTNLDRTAIEKRLIEARKTAEKEGWISRSARFDLMQKVAMSSKTSAAVRDAADRMRSGCPGRKMP